MYGCKLSTRVLAYMHSAHLWEGNINAAFVHRQTHADQQAVATGPCGRFKGRFSVPRQRTQLRLADNPSLPFAPSSFSTFIFTEFSVTIFTN